MNHKRHSALIEKFASDYPSRFFECMGKKSWNKSRKRDEASTLSPTGKCMKSIFFTSLLLCFVTSFLYASDVTISVNASPRIITVGDPVTVTVRIQQKGGVELEHPDIDALLTLVDIVNRTVNETLKEDLLTTEFIYKITAFETGTISIPQIDLAYKDVSGNENKSISEPIDITVTSVLEQGQQAYDIKDIKGPFLITKSILLRILLLIIFVTVCVYGLRLLFQRYKRRKLLGAEDEMETLSPEEKALSRLAKLESADLIASGQVKQFYLALSEIMRQYLLDRCDFNAPDQTTKEILRELRSRKIQSKNIETIKKLFGDSDLVKFAKYFPELHTTNENMTQARTIVGAFTPLELENEERNRTTENTEEKELKKKKKLCALNSII